MKKLEDKKKVLEIQAEVSRQLLNDKQKEMNEKAKVSIQFTPEQAENSLKLKVGAGNWLDAQKRWVFGTRGITKKIVKCKVGGGGVPFLDSFSRVFLIVRELNFA